MYQSYTVKHKIEELNAKLQTNLYIKLSNHKYTD